VIVGLGVDLVDVLRIERLVHQYEERFTARVFTPRERELCARRGSAEDWAARFAAKEAAMKALGTGWTQGVRFLDIELLPTESGKPELVFHGLSRDRASQLGCAQAHVSVTHERCYAVAVVVLEGTPPAS